MECVRPYPAAAQSRDTGWAAARYRWMTGKPSPRSSRLYGSLEVTGGTPRPGDEQGLQLWSRDPGPQGHPRDPKACCNVAGAQSPTVAPFPGEPTGRSDLPLPSPRTSASPLAKEEALPRRSGNRWSFGILCRTGGPTIAVSLSNMAAIAQSPYHGS